MFQGGDRIGRYVIEELLGEGGMGRVYRAHDTRLGRRVALKVLRIDSQRPLDTSSGDVSAQASARLMREARAAAALDHPNAVVVFDVGQIDDTLYIAMEFVPGRTLRSYVGNPDVPWDQKLRYLIDAARALAAAHDRGLVHRDVKPENILVREDGVVKVLDFGIAKRISMDAEASLVVLRESHGRTTGGRMSPIPDPELGEADTAVKGQTIVHGAGLEGTAETVQGTILGTPRYLSPEQVRGEVIDARADQFAWGVTAFETLTGTLPWGAATQPGAELMLSILEKAPPRPRSLMPQLPEIVEETLLRTLAKSRRDRFARMDEVIEALHSYAITRRTSSPRTALALQKTDPAELTEMPPKALTTTSSTKPPPRRRLGLVVAGAAVIALLGVASMSALRRKPSGVTPDGTSAIGASGSSGSSSTMGSPKASAATGFVDAPLPPGGNEAARAQFVAFRRAFHAADWEAAHTALAKAVELDDTYAAAYLRLAWMDSLMSAEELEVRKTYARAMLGRAQLDARDAALLDAFEPYLQRDPSDPAECEKRLASLAESRPADAEIAYFLGSIRYDRGRLAEAKAAFTRVIELDPSFAQALATLGGVQAYLGDLAGAVASLDRCIESSGSATECLWYRAQIDEQEGDCARMEADVRKWISRDPTDSYAYQWLAKSLYAQGKSNESVLAAYEQKWARLSAERRPTVELLDRARLHAATGEFELAKAEVVKLESLLGSEPGALAHAEPSQLLVQIARETGHPADAVSVAESYLARKDAWVTPHRVDDRAIWEDPVPLFLSAMFHGGKLTAAELEEKRTAWLGTWKAKTADAYLHHLWIYAYALPAETKADAEVALTALPGWSPLPPFTPQCIAPAYVGGTYFAAEKWADALPVLRKAANVCVGLHMPFPSLRASDQLGQVLEKTGDVAGACAAYGKVLARWGEAKPPSKTAEHAKTRVKALGCGKN